MRFHTVGLCRRVPDLVHIVAPDENPTLRGSPIGCGPSWRLSVALALGLSAAAAFGVWSDTITGWSILLRLAWFALAPVLLVGWWGSDACKPLHVDPDDEGAVRRLADKLTRFYQQQARAGNSAVKIAAAKVELARAERDPGRFMKRAQVAAQDESGLELPQELRSAFNCDLDGTPYGYGHGTWASWLLPVVWMQPPDQKYRPLL